MAERVLSSKTNAEIAAKNLGRLTRKRKTPVVPEKIQPMHIVKMEKPK